jgi:hypothetical protein
VAPYIRKTLALTSLTSSGRSVGIVRLRAEAMELLFVVNSDNVKVKTNVSETFSVTIVRVDIVNELCCFSYSCDM